MLATVKTLSLDWDRGNLQLYDSKNTTKTNVVQLRKNTITPLKPKPFIIFHNEQSIKTLNATMCSWMPKPEWSDCGLISHLLVCRGGAAGLDKIKMETDEPTMESEPQEDLDSDVEVKVSSGNSIIHHLQK
jgi:hypothetical protein